MPDEVDAAGCAVDGDEDEVVADDEVDAGNDEVTADDEGARQGGDARPDGGPTFQTVDWTSVRATRLGVGPSTALFVVLLVGLMAAFVYDAFILLPAYALVGSFAPTPLDWLVLLAVAFLLCYVVIPLVRDPAIATEVWSAVENRRFGRVSFVGLVVIVLLAALGPEIIGPPTNASFPFTKTSPRPPTSGLAPIGLSVPQKSVLYCSGEVVKNRCFGMLAHPLGTTASGRDVLAYVVGGFRVALNVAMVTSVLLVPMAVLAGTSAAYFGGRVDAVVSRASDFLQVVPVFVLYLYVRLLFGAKLWLLIVLFGLLGWGRIARQVRAEAMSLREEGYVRAAREAGASRLETVMRHLVPNVSHVAVSSLALEIPKLIVVEVTLAYLGLVSVQTPSWGYSIVSGIKDPNLPVRGLTNVSPLRLWWTFVFPLIALLFTVATLSVLVGALGDALDPRASEE